MGSVLYSRRPMWFPESFKRSPLCCWRGVGRVDGSITRRPPLDLGARFWFCEWSLRYCSRMPARSSSPPYEFSNGPREERRNSHRRGATLLDMCSLHCFAVNAVGKQNRIRVVHWKLSYWLCLEDRGVTNWIISGYRFLNATSKGLCPLLV